jgi:hypothetical protein
MPSVFDPDRHIDQCRQHEADDVSGPVFVTPLERFIHVEPFDADDLKSDIIDKKRDQ